MTKSKKLRVLGEIYATIPSTECNGLCVAECASIPVLPIELEQLEDAAGRKLPTLPTGDRLGGRLLGSEIGTPCPLLVLGRCSAYEQRPLICRAFGATDGLLQCPHGCHPTELLSKAALRRAFERIAAL